VRGRRLSREEEKKLLDAALQKMNTPDASIRRDRCLHDASSARWSCVAGARDAAESRTSASIGAHQIGIPRATPKERRIANSVQPKGPARRHPRPSIDARSGRVRARTAGRSTSELQTAWKHLRLLSSPASNRGPRRGKVRRGIVSHLQRIDLPLARPQARVCRLAPTAWTSASSN